jgi:GNAT superfamily N-acetyltransferase
MGSEEDGRYLVERARPPDIDRCAAILNDWIDGTHWMPRVHDHDNVRAHYHQHVAVEREIFVCRQRADVIGFMAIADPGLITALYVDSGYRRQGVGGQLLAQAKRRCPSGLTLWTFEANTAAQAFYQGHGFYEAVRTDGDNEERLPDIRYRWDGSAPVK